MPSLFSFSGRLGRVPYIVGTLTLLIGGAMLLAGAMVAAVFLVGASGPHASAGAAILLWLPIVIVASLVFASGQLSLQVRRIRDIGWHPGLVIGGWFAVCILDAMLAHAVPSLGLQNHHSTIVGMLCNLAMVGALWFWPGADSDQTPSGIPRIRDRIQPEPTTEPLRGMTADVSTRPRTGFGRRGVGGTVGAP